MHFETIEHRRVTIKQSMQRGERKSKIEEYLRQCLVESYRVMEKDKISFHNNIADELYLDIYNESDKFIGIVKITLSNDEKVGYLEISIPNPEWSLRYGTEALHQVIKRCKETSLTTLILNENNVIVTRYKAQRPNVVQKENNEVDFKEV